MAANGTETNVYQVRQLVKELLYPERGFIRVVIAYGIAISLLTLAVPVAVQTLINTVVNIASVSMVITLSVLLFATLALSGVFAALRTYVMEKYERHIYARLTAEISVRTIMTEHEHFEGRRNIDITNRYFDINTFQKNLPPLLVDGFALLLQMIVGFTLVSSYHPVFLYFSLMVVFSLYLIWIVWGRNAIKTAVGLSHAKYATAKWLGDLAAANFFFKSSRQIDFARTHTDDVTGNYIQNHKAHFKYTFAQTVALLLLYALASSALLGTGGVLVIRGELSIGQLVAAELILTAIFFGLSRAGTYLKLYYELCGAADEIGMVFDLPLEEYDQGEVRHLEHSCLTFNQVELKEDGYEAFLDFKLAAGEKAYVVTEQAWLQRHIIHLLKRNEKLERGWIRLGDFDLRDYNVQHLRQAIQVIDRSLIIECSLLSFMKMSAPDASIAEIHQALAKVGLSERIEALGQGIDLELSVLGAPLLPHEFLLLKLAAAIVSKPTVLVITQYFDNMAKEELSQILNMLKSEPFSVLYFTNHPDIQQFDYSLCLDWQKEQH